MEVSQFTTIIIKASQGKKLTQKDGIVDITERLICSEIALGKNDSADNWQEIDADKADELQAQIDAAISAKMEQAE